MGNCFSKTDNDDPAQPGPSAKPAAGGQTLGGPSGQATGSAAAMAAKAAETRAQAAKSKPKGAIGQKLDADRKRTMTSTLQAMSADERRRRDADDAAAARTHN